MKKSHTLLIDGDIIVYKFASANQETVVWEGDEEGETTTLLAPERATEDAIAYVRAMAGKLRCASILIAFSDRRNFRYRVLSTYKHNRADVEKPQLYYKVREALQAEFPYEVWDWLEGDDVMGILMTAEPGKYILASLDKDLKQIPGLHYNWGRDTRFNVTQSEADLFFYTQVLTGDSTDGYSGCPGIGPKRAGILLEPFTSEQSAWESIVDVYKLKGLTEENALQQARVARILRNGEYKDKEPVLWLPPKCESL